MHRIDFPKGKMIGIQPIYELCRRLLEYAQEPDIDEDPITEEAIRKIFIPSVVFSGLALLMEALDDVPDEFVTKEVDRDLMCIQEYLKKEGSEKVIATIGNLDYEETLRKIFPMCDNTIEVLTFVVESFYHEERYENACAGFLFMLLLNPLDADYWLQLGDVLCSCEDYESGVYALRQSMQLDPEEPFVYFYIASACEQLEQYKEAEEYCKKALERIKEDTDQKEELIEDIENMLERLESLVL